MVFVLLIYTIFFSYCLLFILFFCFFFFFFSSRRRHTRWTGDWSSDECSSDLIIGVLSGNGCIRIAFITIIITGSYECSNLLFFFYLPVNELHDFGMVQVEANHFGCTTCSRSEERRVGKECRYRWAREE